MTAVETTENTTDNVIAIAIFSTSVKNNSGPVISK